MEIIPILISVKYGGNWSPNFYLFGHFLGVYSWNYFRVLDSGGVCTNKVEIVPIFMCFEHFRGCIHEINLGFLDSGGVSTNIMEIGLQIYMCLDILGGVFMKIDILWLQGMYSKLCWKLVSKFIYMFGHFLGVHSWNEFRFFRFRGCIH